MHHIPEPNAYRCPDGGSWFKAASLAEACFTRFQQQGCPAIPHLLGPTIANTGIAGSLVFTAP
jgi:hypothetical protein